MTIPLQPLSSGQPIVNPNGTPSTQMQRFWQTNIGRIVQSIEDAATAQAAADAAQDVAITALEDAASAQGDADTAQGTADTALGLATTAVQQDQAAAPVYAAYAGQSVSLGYVQAEALATDNAVKAVGTALAALIAALQTANVLT